MVWGTILDIEFSVSDLHQYYPFWHFNWWRRASNNHHAFASSAKLSSKWYEFDIGWFYIKLLSFLNLATVKVAPKASLSKEVNKYNNDLLNAIITNRDDVINRFRKAIKNYSNTNLIK